MALIGLTNPALSISVCQAKDCQSFAITETTGVYNASSNPGGYGGGVNYDTTDVIDARLVITLPDGTSITIDSSSAIPVYPSLPDSTGLAPFTVASAMLGLSGVLPDGIYTIQYTIDINTVFSTTTQTSVTQFVLFTCTIKCCVDKLFAKISDQGCGCNDCNDAIIQNALLASALYQALCASGVCGNTTNVNCLLDRLNKLCTAKNCGCN